jgi:hypothetical protein
MAATERTGPVRANPRLCEIGIVPENSDHLGVDRDRRALDSARADPHRSLLGLGKRGFEGRRDFVTRDLSAGKLSVKISAHYASQSRNRTKRAPNKCSGILSSDDCDKFRLIRLTLRVDQAWTGINAGGHRADA